MMENVEIEKRKKLVSRTFVWPRQSVTPLVD